MLYLPRSVLWSLLLAKSLAAQLGFATVTVAGEDERVWASRPYQRAIAQSSDGTFFVLVLRASNGSKQRNGDLELWSSSGGSTWQQVTSLPTTHDGLGSVVADPHQPHLHMVWNARDGGEWSSVFHAVFDLQTGTWISGPTCLAPATGSNDQYFANDLCWVGDRLATAIGAHRAPKTRGYSAWCSCIRILEDREKAQWSDPQSLSIGAAAISANLASFDGLLLSAFRTYAEGDHCIATRRWRAQNNKFHGGVVRVAPLAGERRRHTNQGLVAIDQYGHRYVLTALGTTANTEGRIVVSHTAANGVAWTTTTIDDDPRVKGGNTNVMHIALARGPGNQMLAFYSKVSEGHTRLYQQVLDQGRAIGAPRQIGQGAVGAFEQLSGVRETTRVAGVQLVITSGASTTAEMPAPNEVRVYGYLR